MASAVEENVERKTKAYAKDVEKKLKDLVGDIAPRYWRAAELISEIHCKKLWEILGYAKVDDYREAVSPLSRGAWYERRRLFDEFASIAIEKDVITRSRLERMNSQNAKQLLRLPEKLRFTQKWVEYALNLKESQLEAKVDHVLENNDDDETTLGQSEARCILKIPCSTSQKDFILETLKEWNDGQEDPFEGDDLGQILEKCLADVRSGLPTAEERQHARDSERARIH